MSRDDAIVIHRERGGDLVEGPVRILSAWASPPNTSVLVMLGESAKEAPAALRVIRHRLEQKRAEGMWSFAVTSARRSEGKTTLAIQLALVLSESQRARVLLLDACFHSPDIARTLGFSIPQGMGFSAQIVRRMRGGAEPWSVMALGPALHVLADPSPEAAFGEALHSTHFLDAIHFLSRGYDFVIVDTPSVLESGDANVVENAVDGIVVSARSGTSRGSDLRSLVRKLHTKKTVGVVLWDAP